MKKAKTILYLGLKGFPFGTAEVQRQLQISKAISNSTYRILVVNQKGTHSLTTIRNEKIKWRGSYEGIDYIYASGTPLYASNFIVRNLLKVIGWVYQLLIILYYSLTNQLACVIVCTSSLAKLKYFWYITRISNTRLIYDYVEYFSSLADRSIKTAGNKKSFDTVFFKYTDALIIISSYLEQHVNQMKSNRPYIIVPPIIDFEKFSNVKNKPKETDYFLYCGSVQYIDVIQFIIEAYRQSEGDKRGVALILIVNGPSDIITKLKESILQDKFIQIHSGLPYDDLIGYYKNAKALLIPLKDNLQDKARFPFKISEYTASARPIITSDSGAIIEFFKDGENALIAKTGQLSDFSDKLNFIMNHPGKAEQIGMNGNVLGQKLFNYKSYASALVKLISN